MASHELYQDTLHAAGHHRAIPLDGTTGYADRAVARFRVLEERWEQARAEAHRLSLLPDAAQIAADDDSTAFEPAHQLLVLQRQVGKPRFTDTDRAVLAGLLHHLPLAKLRHLLLLVRPDTILRWHRNLLKRRHAAACTPKRRGRPPTPQRQSTTWAAFLRSQAEALLACDLFETRTLTGTRLYVFAVIEHSTRRVRILGAAAHPTADWIVQLGRILLMDLEDACSLARFLIRDRDSKFTAAFDALLADAGLKVVTTGIQMPRMNSLIERWIQTCRRELLDRTLIWNQSHLMHALREFENFYNWHRPHRTLKQAAPLRPRPEPIHVPAHVRHLDVRRRDRLGGTLHEYQHAA